MRLPPVENSEGDGINMTPVIDVVFLLLIFFLVASRFDQQEREQKMPLAEVAEAQPVSMTRELVVNVMQDGKYRVVRKEYSEAELASLMAATHKKNPQQSVLIRPHARVEWRYVARVVGLCTKLNIENYRTAAVEED